MYTLYTRIKWISVKKKCIFISNKTAGKFLKQSTLNYLIIFERYGRIKVILFWFLLWKLLCASLFTTHYLFERDIPVISGCRLLVFKFRNRNKGNIASSLIRIHRNFQQLEWSPWLLTFPKGRCLKITKSFLVPWKRPHGHTLSEISPGDNGKTISRNNSRTICEMGTVCQRKGMLFVN